MPTMKTRVAGVSLLVMSDRYTGRGQVVAQAGARRVHMGELFPQVRDELHAHLSDPDPGIEAWEPKRDWPWKQRHQTHDTQEAALVWLVQRAVARGDL